MGYYVQPERETGQHFGKAQYIVDNYNGRKVTQDEAKQLVESDGVIVVVDNGIFEAAGFAYDSDEFDAFTQSHDTRPKTFVVIDRQKAKELTSFPR